MILIITKWLGLIKNRYISKRNEWRLLSRRKRLAEPNRTGLQKYGAFTDFWVDAIVYAVWDLGVYLIKKYKIMEYVNLLRSKKFWLDILTQLFYLLNVPKKPWRFSLFIYVPYKLTIFALVLVCFGLQFILLYTLDCWWVWLTTDLEYTALIAYILWLHLCFHGF